MMKNRLFITVLDSFGIGALPDAADYGDEGSDTLGAVMRSDKLKIPNMARMGLFNIEGNDRGSFFYRGQIIGAYGRLAQQAKGKDTTVGHWEIAGVTAKSPMPVYPEGFPREVLAAFKEKTGLDVLCNRPYSGTQVIADYGEEHIKTKKPILYTSADSVLQLAAHEVRFGLERLYECCKAAREIMVGRHGVGRVIARPFIDGPGGFVRTANRKDYSLEPTGVTILDVLKKKDYDVIGIGKISDIFAGRGITASYKTKSNVQGIEKMFELQRSDFNGLCFVNLVDFDMLYGHRNDIDGYALALSEFDRALGEFIAGMKEADTLFITADHGCDPSTDSTDHSREYVPLLAYGKAITPGADIGTRKSFADIAATTAEIFGLPQLTDGQSFWSVISQRKAL